MAYDPTKKDVNVSKDPMLNGVSNALFNPMSQTDALQTGWGSVLGPAHSDTSGVKATMNRGFGLTDALGGERAGYGGLFDPRVDVALQNDQAKNIDYLQDLASGKVESPAEMQLREQAARNSAGAYGTAAALQGRNPGAALRMALDSAFKTNADANIQAAIARQQAQQQAQQQLVQAIQTARGQQQNLLSNDTDWRKALLTGQLGALGIAGKAAGDEADASAKDAAASNQYKGSLLQGGGGLLAML